MGEILEKLKGGDLRSIGRSEEVVQDILKNPKLFGVVFEGLFDNDPLVRMRAADALEKVSNKHQEYLQPFKTRLIDDAAKIKQQEVRWHVAQMFSRIELNTEEREKVVEILFSYLIDTEKSNIVKVFSMQTLADLAENDKNIRLKVLKRLEEALITGSPAILSRGKKLIKKLKSE